MPAWQLCETLTGPPAKGAGRGKSFVYEGTSYGQGRVLMQGGVGKEGPNLHLSPPPSALPMPPMGCSPREASWEGRPAVWTLEVSLAGLRAEQTVHGAGGLQLENQSVQ